MVENADNGNLVGELVFVKWRGTDEFAGLTWRQGLGSSVEIRERQGCRSVSELWGSEARGILAQRSWASEHHDECAKQNCFQGKISESKWPAQNAAFAAIAPRTRPATNRKRVWEDGPHA
jgi:hypothetical protein